MNAAHTAAHFSSPSNAAVKHACKAILSGDFDRARAELGAGYAITPVQGRMLIGSLREAARRFNVPHLAERSPLNI